MSKRKFERIAFSLSRFSCWGNILFFGWDASI